MPPRPPTSTPFPYTTLFRSCSRQRRRQPSPEPALWECGRLQLLPPRLQRLGRPGPRASRQAIHARAFAKLKELKDRKSTRLNSSHVEISYAVFCLKKKTSVP